MSILLKSRGIFFKVLMAAFAALFCSIGYAQDSVSCSVNESSHTEKCISSRITPNANGRLYFLVEAIAANAPVLCRFRVINQTTNTVLTAKNLVNPGSAFEVTSVTEKQTLRGLPIRHRYVVEVKIVAGAGSTYGCGSILSKAAL